MTLQRYLRGYSRLCGMTGTARDAAAELRLFYGLDVVVIPTHRPVRRIDRPDLVFTHRAAKEAAVIADVARAHAAGRPVLVGTLTVAESERLDTALRSQASRARCSTPRRTSTRRASSPQPVRRRR